jgi:hypothetical protein
MLLILYFVCNPLVVLVIAYSSSGSIILRPDYGSCHGESIGPQEMMNGQFEASDYPVDFYIVMQDLYEKNYTLPKPDLFILHEFSKQADILIEPVNTRRQIYILFFTEIEQRVDYQFYFETPAQNFMRIASPFLNFFAILMVCLSAAFIIKRTWSKRKDSHALLEYSK